MTKNMASAKLNLPGGIPLKQAILDAVRTIDHPCDSTEITTHIAQVPKGARGWHETHARVRTALTSLSAHGNLSIVASKPYRYTFVRDLDDAIRDRKRDYTKKIGAGTHALYGIYMDVGRDGTIVAIHSKDRQIVRETYSPLGGCRLEHVDVKGMSFIFVRNKVHAKTWQVVERGKDM